MYVLGIDFGGGSSKATLLSKEGRVVATSSYEYKTYYGNDGKAEQDPRDWYIAAKENIKDILSRGFNKKDIDMICFDAATHIAVLLDENDEIIANSIYWTDIRSIMECEELNKECRDYIFEKCKHYPGTIWTLPQLMYFKKHNPDGFKRIKHILFAKDYVRHLFAPGYVTDYIEAQGSMLFDFDSLVWDEKLLSIVGLSKQQMPEIKKPLDVIGTIDARVAEECGLDEHTKIICGCTDTAMEVFAGGGVKKGEVTLKLATAGRMCFVLDHYEADKNIINYSHLIDGLYYPGTATKACASSLRWFRDTFGESFDDLIKEASNVPLGSDGLIYLPYLLGELSPIGNPNVRSSFFGISANHTKGHFVKALMEGVSLSLLDCFNYLVDKGLNIDGKVYLIGGGAKNVIWKQITADVLGLKLYIPKNSDSSFGSAMLAGIASGYFKDYVDAFNTCNEILDEITPNMDNHQQYLKIFANYQKIKNFILEYYGNE